VSYCHVHRCYWCDCRLARACVRVREAALLVIGCVLLLAGCGLLSAAESPTADPCAVEIARLEGLRTAEVAATCAGQTFDECPAVTGIDLKYAPLIDAQVRCGAAQ